MLLKTPPMGWNTWNTFGHDPNEALILESTDAMVELGYKDAGYEYIIIDDCWALPERDENGRMVPDPEKFPHGMKYIADYIHSKGLKFGMYSCAGVRTCANYPGSYGYEYIDAATFASWGVDYLKYDFCFFPSTGNGKNAYMTMAQALRTCGRDIVFAACNWGTDDPAKWMRSHGAHTWRSTEDIQDSPKSFLTLFEKQRNNFEFSTTDCYNDMDMLTVGMHGKGLVGLGGCTDQEYLMQFSMWAFLGSPLIMGADIRKLSDTDRKLLQHKGLIAINQDAGARPPFSIGHENWNRSSMYARLLSDNQVAVGTFRIQNDEGRESVMKRHLSFRDLGYRSESKCRVYDVIEDKDLGIHQGGLVVYLKGMDAKIFRVIPVEL